MIARIWQGRIRACDVEEYRAYISATGLVDYRSTPGNLGAEMLTRVDGDVAHVITLSFWNNLESIHAFAGADVTRARYYPEDARFLLDFPERVEHYDVVD
jgi:heme-degrading monooxygenase HmoA